MAALAAAAAAAANTQEAKLAAAQQAYDQQCYRTAAHLCTMILQEHPGHAETSLLLTKVLSAAGKPQAAAEVSQKVATSFEFKLEPGSDSSVPVEVLKQLGISQTAAGWYEDALESNQRASALISVKDPMQLSLQALMATALCPQGGAYAEVARSLVTTVLQQDPQCQPALMLYAQMMADEGNWAEAAKVFLQLLAHQPRKKQVQQLLAQAAQHPAGMEQLLIDTGYHAVTTAAGRRAPPSSSAAPPSDAESAAAQAETAAVAANIAAVESASEPAVAKTAAATKAAAAPSETAAKAASADTAAAPAANLATALSFLAGTILCHGAVHEAVDLYSKAVQLQPECGTYSLGVIQALELDLQYSEALDIVLEFCAANTDVHVGCLSLKVVHKLLASQQLLPRPANGTPCRGTHCQHLATMIQAQLLPTPRCLAAVAAARDGVADQPGSAGAVKQRFSQLQLSSTGSSNGTSGSNSSNSDQGHGDITSHSAASQLRHCPCNQIFSYNKQELDILALLLTAVKVLFCKGALTAAAELLQLCNAAVAAAATPLHETHIRSVTAYAECITQLLLHCQDCEYPLSPVAQTPSAGAAAAVAAATQEAAATMAAAATIAADPTPVPGLTSASAAVAAELPAAVAPAASAAAGTVTQRSGRSVAPTYTSALPDGISTGLVQPPVDVVYLCGDSHCLSGAWRVINIAGKQRLLQPLLITGLKVWHLRSSSNFYTKHQFWNAIRSIPHGSDIVVVVGEIDCREGLLAAVEKLKHPCLQQAIEATVDKHISVLCQLVNDHGLTVYVHPVPLVLEATREVVLQFEYALKRSVEQKLAVQAVQQIPGVQDCDSQLRGRLHYLDFSQQLLDENGQLKREFELDGTHLHPSYLKHLEAAMTASVLGAQTAATY